MGMAKITRNFQVTIPKDVRQVQNLHEGDKVLFIINDGGVVLKKVDEDVIEKTAGIWKGMKETGLQYQRRLRREWKKREERWS